MSDTWTIGELAERAADTLGPAAPRPNGRVRDVPNERLIRWYTTIGLLDPPLTRRGRVALYGRRHLLQLVAVKRRQADGLSIADIQAELTGATDGALEAIARLPAPDAPDHPDHTDGAAVTDPTAPPAPPRPRFWAQHPAPPAAPSPAPAPVTAPPVTAPPVVTPSVVTPSVVTPSEADPFTAPSAPSAPSAPPFPVPSAAAAPADGVLPHADGLVHGVRLAPGITLLLDGRAPSPGDIAALREAAAPLLSVLNERHLSGPSEGMHP
ncbi:helix-turn-helix domain-containing protein [Sphaerisporangium sp. NPDC051011]|uniref:helix-turn-helix domain-containing protein n=1 Tax=Sphaerisporangium sp. NPDC051011 TaxID=3155792 RepID=UPI0033DF3AE3